VAGAGAEDVALEAAVTSRAVALLMVTVLLLACSDNGQTNDASTDPTRSDDAYTDTTSDTQVIDAPSGVAPDGFGGVAADGSATDEGADAAADLGIGNTTADGGTDGGVSIPPADGGTDTLGPVVRSWVDTTPAPAFPLSIAGHAMVYDRVRKGTVLFGGQKSLYGIGPDFVGDTWTWDGANWIRMTPDHAPSPRTKHVMAYDPDRSVVVLFGGIAEDGAALSDTWEWDGVDWSLREPSLPMLKAPAMAYDEVRKAMVLTGQAGSFQTYVWSADAWTPLHPSPAPPRGGRMVWDGARRAIVLTTIESCVLQREDLSVCDSNGTWQWDGSAWSQLGARFNDDQDSGFMFYDPISKLTSVLNFAGGMAQLRPQGWTFGSRIRVDNNLGVPSLLGGAQDTARNKLIFYRWDHATSYTVEVDGSAATYIRTASPIPLVPAAYSSAVGFSAGQGAVVDMPLTRPTTEPRLWKGASWTPTAPIATWETPCGGNLQDPATAFDGGAGSLLLFASCFDPTLARYSFTYQWDGATWTKLLPAHRPSYRYLAGMARDTRRGVSVLFGGSPDDYRGAPLGDTWEWDGSDWTNRSPNAGPPARISPLMTYDSARGVVVMVGGFLWVQGSPLDLSDTWEWDGSVWVERTTPNTPAADGRGAIAYDSDRHVTVLVPSYFSTGSNTTATWEWDGQTWRQTATMAALQRPYGMAYDRARKVMVMLGSNSPFVNQTTTTTWEYRPTPSP
jgi:hypothetical protein